MTLMVVVTILRKCTRACMRVHASVFGEAGAGGGGSNFPALGTRQKMGLLSKTPGTLLEGLRPLERLVPKRRALSRWIPVWGLGNKGCFPEVQEGVCVCVCVCGRQGARRGGGDGHSWRRMLGHFAVKASFDLWS